MRHTPPDARNTGEPLRLFARLPTVVQATGLGRSTIYRLIANGTFPAPVHLGPRAVARRPRLVVSTCRAGASGWDRCLSAAAYAHRHAPRGRPSARRTPSSIRPRCSAPAPDAFPCQRSGTSRTSVASSSARLQIEPTAVGQTHTRLVGGARRVATNDVGERHGGPNRPQCPTFAFVPPQLPPEVVRSCEAIRNDPGLQTLMANGFAHDLGILRDHPG